MNKATIFTLLLTVTASYQSLLAQTLYVPSGTSGIGTSSNSNVGIGTTNTPAEKLTVKGNVRIEGDGQKQFSNLSFYRYNTPSQPFATIGFGDPTQTNTTFDISEHNGNAIRFMQGTSERVRITSAGDVGIGMNTPDARLSLQAAAPGNLITMKATNSTALLKMGLTSGYAWIQSAGPAPLRINDSGGNVIFNAAGGNVLIAKTSQSNLIYRLDVNGSIRSNEIVVNTTGADFVFEENYKLATLDEIEKFIIANKHLPDIESATEMEKNGLHVGQIEMKLLQKIEELTLHMINLKKEITEVSDDNKKLKKVIRSLKKN